MKRNRIKKKIAGNTDSESRIDEIEPIDPHKIPITIGLKPRKDQEIEHTTECAFGIDPLPGGICSPPQELHKMKEFILSKKKEKEEDTISLSSLNEPVKIVEKVKKVLHCTTESCIYEAPEFRSFIGETKAQHILEEHFLPVGPRNNTNLLSNHNIEAVLNQFTKEFPDFVHIPFQMLDFLETKTELVYLDLLFYLKQGYRRFGCVFNTDVSTGKGKHWFCLFLDFSKLSKQDVENCLHRSIPTLLRCTPRCTIEYFNSSGNPARPQVEYWCINKEKELRRQLKGINSWIIKATDLRHQWSHTECGVYSLFYIWQRLQGRSYIEFAENWITDEQMIQARKSFFRERIKPFEK